MFLKTDAAHIQNIYIKCELSSNHSSRDQQFPKVILYLKTVTADACLRSLGQPSAPRVCNKV